MELEHEVWTGETKVGTYRQEKDFQPIVKKLKAQGSMTVRILTFQIERRLVAEEVYSF